MAVAARRHWRPRGLTKQCKRFRDNEVPLQLHALDDNFATFLRCIELPEKMAD